MKKLCLIILFLLSTGVSVQAQDDTQPKGYRYNNYFDIGGNIGDNEGAGTLSWVHLHGIGHKKQRLKIGYGLRFTSYVGANKWYTTAPSKYTSTNQGPFTIFSETIEGNIDTIALVTPQVNLINLSINIEYNVWRSFDLGFNIDAIGFSFGGKQKANVLSSSFDAGQSPVTTAKPTSFNLLLTSDNDIGSLNSEFFVRYWISPKFGVRAGYSFLFTEYRTETKLSFDNNRIENDRYRLKTSMFLLAFTYKPFNK